MAGGGKSLTCFEQNLNEGEGGESVDDDNGVTCFEQNFPVYTSTNISWFCSGTIVGNIISSCEICAQFQKSQKS